MTYDVDAVRAHFPSLASGLAHFDGPGGSQTPLPVAQAVAETLTSSIANRGRVTASERTAETVVQDARRAMADLLDAEPAGIVFGRSMTQLTYDLARTLAVGWGPGDEVVVTRLDHDANVRPWVQAAERVGATVRWAGFDRDTGELTVDDVRAVLGPRTRLVAFTASSNLLGSRPDVAAIAAAIHEAGALAFVDGVHYTAHALVDMSTSGADFFVCSPYKFCGPHCGVLAADPALLDTLHPDKLLPSSNAVPERFELGTLPYELLAGTTAAVDFLAGLDPDAIGPRRQRLTASLTALEHHENDLFDRLLDGLSARDTVTRYGQPRDPSPTVLFSVAGIDSPDVYRGLAERGVNAPAGSFYAVEPSRWIGLGDTGAVRAGLAPYSTTDDVDRLLTALDELAR